MLMDRKSTERPSDRALENAGMGLMSSAKRDQVMVEDGKLSNREIREIAFLTFQARGL